MDRLLGIPSSSFLSEVDRERGYFMVEIFKFIIIYIYVLQQNKILILK